MRFIVFFRSSFVRFSVLVLSVLALTACAGTQPFPLYPSTVVPLSNYDATAYGISFPVYGQKIQRAEGNYYLIQSPSTDIERWYRLLVAEQTLVFIDAKTETSHAALLFQYPQNDYQTVEVSITPVTDSSSILAIYESLDTAGVATDHANAWERFWGWLLGWTQPAAIELLLNNLLQWFSFLSGPYNGIFLKPFLNMLILLRALLPIDYTLTLIVFAFFTTSYIAAVRLLPALIAELVWHSQNEDSQSVWLTLTKMFGPIMLVAPVAFFSSLAIWQALTMQYDISQVGRARVAAFLYDWLPYHSFLTGMLPPSGKLLGISLSKPNIIIVPVLVMVLTAINEVAQAIICNTIVTKAEQNGTYDALKKTAYGEILIAYQQKTIEDPINFFSTVAEAAIKKGAVLAFIPSGVSLFFLVETVRSTYAQVLQTLEKTSDPSVGSDNSGTIRILRYIQRGSLILVIGWILLLLSGLERTPASVVSVQPTDHASNETVIEQPTETLFIPDDVIGKVTTRSLRVRSKPTTTASVVAGLNQNDTVYVLAKSTNQDWYYVTSGTSTVGWVSARFIALEGTYTTTDIPIDDSLRP